ncbi:TMEM175 family protein [Rhodococcus sp. 27YEA15]|uniref:TMEM175 family protein n=1 Tax=Rhodococcus sp. 27YEA15 TaxID=3156259 RepID=UPI003C79AEE3
MAESVERTRYFERYITFVDAIAAIAITLLVLPLVELTSDHDGTTVELLREHQNQFYAFALSFIVIFRLWWAQHSMLRYVTDGDRIIVRALALWALTIVFLPFPTALVATTSTETATRVLYLGTMTIGSIALALIAWALTRNPALAAEDDTGDHLVPTVITALIMLIALVSSALVPMVSYFPLLLLVFAGQFEKLWRKAAARR